MIEFKDVYYGDCQHVFSDDIRSSDCIHRFFNVSIPTHKFYGRVIICNEYFRLKVRERFNRGIGCRSTYGIDEIARKIILDALNIEDIVFHSDKLGGYSFGKQNDDILKGVSYAICKRPYITLNVSLELAINTLSDDTTSEDYELRWSTYNRLNYLSTRILRLAKYKKYHNQVYQIMKKIMPNNHNFEYDTETHSLYNPLYKDLMVLLFEILTKKQLTCSQ